MYWIVENNLHGEEFYEKLLGFLERFDIPYETNRCIPFSGEFLKEPEIPEGMNVMVIGSYSMTQEAQRRGWVPGTFVNENYDYRIWSREWKGFCFNEPAEIYLFGEVPEQEGDFFLRPCEDTKLFTGHVKNWEEFKEWQERVLNIGCYTDLNKDTPILIAEPKKIEAEYRFVVIDEKVITGSLYKQGNTALQQEVDEYKDAVLWEFASLIADLWSPERAYALDVCLSEGKYYVLEMGCMNAAGLYHCDVQKIVMALEEMEF